MIAQKKKICIVLSSLSNGGTERFGSLQSKIFTDLGCEVHVLITKDKVEYGYFGTLFNLEKESKLGTIGKLLTLSSFFKANKFDVIIDNRGRASWVKELIFWKLFYRNSERIAMVHNFKLENYFPINKNVSKAIYSKDTMFVCVSKKIKERVKSFYNFKNVTSIYNPINYSEISVKSQGVRPNLDYKYILYFGRLEEVAKNLTLLIKSYNASVLKEKFIKLLIMGKGDDLSYLKNLVNTLNLNDNIIFIDYQPEPFPYVKEAICTVLSSKYEGFPMSIIESLAIGTPVVSVDCDSGPSEVIIHRKNGLLVENNNIEALAEALNEIVLDEKLYETCKSNAVNSIKHLDVNEIMNEWKTLIDDE